MMQIWFLSNGSYSLKKCHNPFGKAIQPPPPYGKIPVEHGFSLRGASLTNQCLSCLNFSLISNKNISDRTFAEVLLRFLTQTPVLVLSFVTPCIAED